MVRAPFPFLTSMFAVAYSLSRLVSRSLGTMAPQIAALPYLNATTLAPLILPVYSAATANLVPSTEDFKRIYPAISPY